MKLFRLLLLTAVAISFAQNVANAEIMRGEVTAVDAQERSITINQLDQSGIGVTRENLEIKLREDTQFTGIKSLQELKAGDEVLLEANKRIFGPWEVKHIQSTKPGAGAGVGVGAPMKAEAQKAVGEAQKQASQPIAAAQQVSQPKPASQTAGVLPSATATQSPQGVNQDAKLIGQTPMQTQSQSQAVASPKNTGFAPRKAPLTGDLPEKKNTSVSTELQR